MGQRFIGDIYVAFSSSCIVTTHAEHAAVHTTCHESWGDQPSIGKARAGRLNMSDWAKKTSMHNLIRRRHAAAGPWIPIISINMFVCLFICCRFYLIIKKKSAASEKKITAKKKIATTWNRTHDVGFNRHAILNHWTIEPCLDILGLNQVLCLTWYCAMSDVLRDEGRRTCRSKCCPVNCLHIFEIKTFHT